MQPLRMKQQIHFYIIFYFIFCISTMVLKLQVIICVILNYELYETIPSSIQQLELNVKLEVVTIGSRPLDLVT